MQIRGGEAGQGRAEEHHGEPQKAAGIFGPEAHPAWGSAGGEEAGDCHRACMDGSRRGDPFRRDFIYQRGRKGEGHRTARGCDEGVRPDCGQPCKIQISRSGGGIQDQWPAYPCAIGRGSEGRTVSRDHPDYGPGVLSDQKAGEPGICYDRRGVPAGDGDAHRRPAGKADGSAAGRNFQGIYTGGQCGWSGRCGGGSEGEAGDHTGEEGRGSAGEGSLS